MKSLFKQFRSKLTLAVAIVFCAMGAYAQDNYRTVTNVTGDWSGGSTWEKDNAGDLSFSATATPPTNANSIAIDIRSGATVTVTAGVTIDQTVVNGTLVVAASQTLTLASTATIELTVNSGGVLTNNGIIAQGGSGTREMKILSGGVYNAEQGSSHSGHTNTENLFENGCTYNHNYTTTAGTIVTGTWGATSTCVVKGYTSNTAAPEGLNQAFGHFTWNLASYVGGAYLTLVGLPNSIAGDYIIMNTGAAQDGIMINSGGGSVTINVGGKLEVSGGSWVSLSGTGGDVTAINAASFNLLYTSGNATTFDFGDAGTSSVTLTGNFTASNAGSAIQNSSGSATPGFIFNGTSTATITSGILSGDVDFTVNNGASLSLPSGSAFGGGGHFTVNASGTLKVGNTHASGAIQNSTTNGAITTSGTRVFTAGCTIELNGSAAQFIGTYTNPYASNNVTINNSNGVTFGTGFSTLGSSNTLTFTSGKLSIGSNTFTINGNVSGMSATNSFTVSSSSNIVIGGSGAMNSIFFDGSNNTIGSLTYSRTSGTLTLGNALNIAATGNLDIQVGTFTTGGFLTFKSTASGTAQLKAVSGTPSGDFTVERYIQPSFRAWRFLASPVSQSFASAWKQQIHITGAGTGGTACPGTLADNSNGFDPTSNNSPSVFTYNTAGSAWTALANTSTSLTPGVGYRIYIRGPRSTGCTLLDGTNPSPATVTLAATGAFGSTVNFGNVSVSCVSSGTGFNLVGNPYPATIDWDNTSWSTARGANFNNAVYVWQPTNNQYGSYVSGVSTNNGSQYISSGQGFFVKCNSSTNLVFAEAYKSTANSGSATFMKTKVVVPVLYATFNDVSATPVYNDEVAVAFRDNATRTFDNSSDAQCMQFATGNMATINTAAPTYYAINSIPTLTGMATDTVYYPVNYPAADGNFTLTFKKQNLPAGMSIMLYDNYTSQSMNIAANNLVYNYSTTSNPASRAANRIQVVFGASIPATSSLPVVLTNFTASKSGSKADISWQTTSEKNNSHFIVERSTDNLNFYELQTVKGAGNSNSTNTYSIIDEMPVNSSVNYYRLKQVDMNNSTTLSHVVAVDFNGTVGSTANNLSVFPVPASSRLNFNLQHNYAGSVTVNIYNNFGDLVIEKSFAAGTFNAQTVMNVESLSSGVYHIRIVDDASSRSENVEFIKE